MSVKDLDPAFGNWIAGFIDGEGCFTINGRAKGCWTCRFSLDLRADDLPILEEIHRATGIGWVGARTASQRGDTDHKPQAIWITYTKRDCVALIELLDRYPLRAKKARDYAIWKQAVAEWLTVRTGGPGRGNDWSRIEAAAAALKEGRRYRDGLPLPFRMADTHQLELEKCPGAVGVGPGPTEDR